MGLGMADHWTALANIRHCPAAAFRQRHDFGANPHRRHCQGLGHGGRLPGIYGGMAPPAPAAVRMTFTTDHGGCAPPNSSTGHAAFF